MARTEVLLATYNGARFLGELLASLDAQTDQDWVLVARDDGSADASVAMLQDWGAAHPGRFRLVEDGRATLGASGNFGALLAESRADHFLLCDQDDVWMPDKVARLRAAMLAAEAAHGAETPIIVHTDMTVADADLRTAAPSFWRHQRLAWPDRDAPWIILALQNSITGCAMIGNAALRDRALPIPDEAMMHDWWLALVAASMGRIIDDPEPSVHYRQHEGNALGAKSWRTLDLVIWVVTGPLRSARRARFILASTRRQARCFARRYGSQMNPQAHRFIHEYGHLPELGI
ncbi:MAG TPA: glycosyltransferase family 2 protein, partial [Thermohalobaculum sp.]|nr:glycosyltransferase family 2 protein [Thermohalobaculum sp.]